MEDLYKYIGFTAAYVGAGWYLFTRIKSKIKELENKVVKEMSEYMIEWQQEQMPKLANNMRILEIDLMEEFGGELSTENIYETFNPGKTLMENYLRIFPQEKKRLYKELEKLVLDQ